jgi:NAD(P)-dependent dehydrogenase (short-subunit alcohol dehydrogenase family)
MTEPSPAALFDLTGRVAVVTGGSRGIGRAIAGGLAAAGADVVIASRKLDSCEKAASEITAATGRRTLPVAAHVGHWNECDRLIDTVYAEFGRCDILVNNAGMSPLYDNLTSITDEYFDKVIGVNLKGPFRLGVTAGARMADSDGGRPRPSWSTAAPRPG